MRGARVCVRQVGPPPIAAPVTVPPMPHLSRQASLRREGPVESALSAVSLAEPKVAKELRPAEPRVAELPVDLLFHVCCFLDSPKRLFAARRVCGAWRERVDGTAATSLEWYVLFTAFMSRGPEAVPYKADFDWRSLVWLNVFEIINTVAKITSGGYPSGDDRHALTPEELERTLTSIRAAGERTAIGGVSFKSIISMRLNTKPALSQLIHVACTQKPPMNHTERLYEWWSTSLPEMRAAVQSALLSCSDERKRAGCYSFDSYVKLMKQGLDYVERFYVKRMSLEGIQSIGLAESTALRAALLGEQAEVA